MSFSATQIALLVTLTPVMTAQSATKPDVAAQIQKLQAIAKERPVTTDAVHMAAGALLAKNTRVRQAALDCVAALRPNLAEACKWLRPVLSAPPVQYEGSWNSSIPAAPRKTSQSRIAQQLASDQVLDLAKGLHAVGLLQKVSKPFARRTIELASHGDWRVRRAALQVLGGHPRIAGALKTILASFQDPQRGVRIAAIRATKPVTKKDRALAADQFAAALPAAGRVERTALLQRIKDLRFKSPKLVVAVGALLNHEDAASIQGYALDALAAMRVENKDVVGKIVHAFHEARPHTQVSAALALGRVGPKAQSTAQETLLPHAYHKNPLLRVAILRGLSSCGRGSAAARVALLEALLAKHVAVRKEAQSIWRKIAKR